VNVLDTEELPNLLEPSSEAPGFYELELSSSRHVFFIDIPSNPHFAVVNERTAKALYEISQVESCRFKVYMSVEKYTSLSIKDMKPEKKIVLQVDLVIYGVDASKSIIGRLLSDSKIYLQHPCYQDPDTLYDNPHVLAITDLLASSSLSSTTISRTRTPLNNYEDPILATSTDLGAADISQDILQRQMGKVFGSLTRFKSLKRLEADITVTTQLLP
jgi:SWI/SNF-related matrix-associated actin-dependent regulator of chromatin subfamily A3